ncbi:hypothetical protein Golob_006881 [Gossypium lobatum]|uniref:Uncharacterized protein n=1 Tax=Gossypium lobatum TaxID=34289 RepID=A0A7J8NIM3_9ROSI|nr:hypothetical protein [Gossypium lobatum]
MSRDLCDLRIHDWVSMVVSLMILLLWNVMLIQKVF